MSNTGGMVSNPGTGYTIVTHVLPLLDRTEQGVAPAGPLQRFLKGEPKALGTVQIMLGVVMLLFGIVITTLSAGTIFLDSGITIWGALMYVATGALSVAASNKLNRCLVKGSLVMNVLNTVTAGIAIILFSIELPVFHIPDTDRMSLHPYNDVREEQLSVNSSYLYYDGDAFIYYTIEDNGYVSDLDYGLRDLPSGVIGVLLVLSILQFIVSILVSAFGCKAVCNNEPLWMYTASADSVSSPPVESPPEYSPPETKGQMCY